ncbi:MAG: hypothetical protein COB04_13895 [Gammaproteobacteria bacterium]|nr:MAG: hypothetical protein COB04_13895 [Gammaproteobacteria bacterium]
MPPTRLASLLGILMFVAGSHLSYGNSQFDPELLSQSTVRILIKQRSQIISAATGFVWQKPNQIVTSLHVMNDQPGTKIIIEFEKKKRLATVKSVLAGADLVLLEVKRPIEGWVPLHRYNAEKPKYKTDISALGFNKGATGMSTRELKKGYVKPETLEVLLPPHALHQLAQSNILDLKLPIYYLDGSLLPGYSGSPIVNDQGTLIGIGDGGLENGAGGVSWVIPAYQLANLTQSATQSLPKSLGAARSIFSTDNVVQTQKRAAITPNYNPSIWSNFLINSAQAGVSPSGTEKPTDEFEQDRWPEEYKQTDYFQFSFIKTKSRTFNQILNSSDHSKGLKKIFTVFNLYFHDYSVDYGSFVFDVYEDSQFGLNIVVPSGINLSVDKNKYLVAEGEILCRTCPYEIQYHIRNINQKNHHAITETPNKFLNELANQHWNELNAEGDYGEYTEFREIESFGNNKHILRAAFSDLDAKYQDQFELNYLTIASNEQHWFQAQGILNRFDHKFLKDLDKYRHTDCREIPVTNKRAHKKKKALCKDIETTLKILLSVHLTTFSNKIINTQASKTLPPINIPAL